MKQPQASGLSVSIVVYYPDQALLERTLLSLGAAWVALREVRPDFTIECSLVDNGGFSTMSESLATLRSFGIENSQCIGGHGNVGYGRGHNMAIARSDSRFHLVLNPDIDMDRDALIAAIDFCEGHREVGLLSPRIGGDDGKLQYLCRRYPTVLDLFVRGFLPKHVRQCFDRRLARYEMRDSINERDIVWDPQIVSGCFMFFRTPLLKQLGGFDERYFLYFEDYDLSLRTGKLTRVVYMPQVKVLHHGGGAARKGWLHVRLFIDSAFKFYQRFGWKFL